MTVEVSQDFTIEDIRKIREENYLETLHMSMEEKVAHYNAEGEAFEREMEERRRLRHAGQVDAPATPLPTFA